MTVGDMPCRPTRDARKHHDTPPDVAYGPPGLPRTIEWVGGDDGFLRLLDQTRLPREVVFRECRDAQTVWKAIRELCVRGAPAIGVAGAYGLYLGARAGRDEPRDAFLTRMREVAEFLDSSRPTAVNLSWALRRMRAAAQQSPDTSTRSLLAAMLAEAHAMAREDAVVCRRIGECGEHLIPEAGAVLTHCNAGALATVAWGTALSLMYVAHERGRRFRVFADETRPLLQGARLTAFELHAAGIDVTVLCDNAAPSLLAAGAVQLVVVGADRIAANGDTANKIGTLGVAIAAARYGVPFYVAAPRSTFDLAVNDGHAIPIEQRPEQEVRGGFGLDVVAPGVTCHNPAFDVTPAELITGIITEGGIVQPVTRENIAAVLGG